MARDGGHVSYRQQYVRCRKQGCSRCAEGPGHGPYWYAAWREGGRVRTRYIGKTLPDDALAEGTESTRARLQAAAGELHVPRLRQAPDTARIDTERRPGLRIWTLGQFRVEVGGVLVPEVAWRRQAAIVMLKLLLLADFRRLPREHIANHLWPDADTETSRKNLASAVHALRRALEPTLTTATKSHYIQQAGVSLVLSLGPGDWVDYLEFEARLLEAAAATDPLPSLERAVALYGGDLMPEEQNPWCMACREALRLRWCGALLTMAEAQAARRRLDAAIATLSRLLIADPTNEEAARRLMSILGQRGRRSEALRYFANLNQAMRDELGTEPAPETVAIAEALKAGRSLPRSRRQVLSVQAQTAETANESASGELIGRTEELERARLALLAARDGTGQAMLITGTAGIGKTRLAEEVAAAATILGFTMLWGRAAESEQELPYAAIADVLHGYVQSRPPAALRRDLHGAEALQGLVPEVISMLPGLAEPPPLENPAAERLRLWMAVRLLLAAAASHRPVLIILD
ncbi:MAG: tetratricopeptide repeat protein, partial [Chloroflexi bacterium]|nr:tetratricopeptide repeat protein [Chloroflexota bacterium]